MALWRKVGFEPTVITEQPVRDNVRLQVMVLFTARASLKEPVVVSDNNAHVCSGMLKLDCREEWEITVKYDITHFALCTTLC